MVINVKWFPTQYSWGQPITFLLPVTVLSINWIWGLKSMCLWRSVTSIMCELFTHLSRHRQWMRVVQYPQALSSQWTFPSQEVHWSSQVKKRVGFGSLWYWFGGLAKLIATDSVNGFWFVMSPLGHHSAPTSSVHCCLEVILDLIAHWCESGGFKLLICTEQFTGFIAFRATDQAVF